MAQTPNNRTDHLRLWDEAESLLSPGRYSGAAAPDTVHEIAGDIHILFSAPHAVAHMRHGLRKPADMGTGGLVVALAGVTGAHGLLQVGVASQDGNWHGTATYKQHLYGLLDRVGTVIDLHGMKDSHGLDVCVGTGRYSLASVELIANTLDALSDQGLRVAVNAPYDAHREGTVTSFCQRRGTPAIQLELSNTARLPRTPQSDALVSALRHLVEAL